MSNALSKKSYIATYLYSTHILQSKIFSIITWLKHNKKYSWNNGNRNNNNYIFLLNRSGLLDPIVDKYTK